MHTVRLHRRRGTHKHSSCAPVSESPRQVYIVSGGHKLTAPLGGLPDDIISVFVLHRDPRALRLSVSKATLTDASVKIYYRSICKMNFVPPGVSIDGATGRCRGVTRAAATVLSVYGAD